MRERRIILESRVAMSVVVWFLLGSCASGTGFLGTYSFCNERGYYMEVSFLSPTDLVISHEVQPAGHAYTYRIAGDSMFTYDLDGHEVSECRIVSSSLDKIAISVTEGDNIYHFDYVLISADPLLSHTFPDTLSDEYKKYEKDYSLRSMARNCIKMAEPGRLNLDRIDTVFDDF